VTRTPDKTGGVKVKDVTRGVQRAAGRAKGCQSQWRKTEWKDVRLEYRGDDRKANVESWKLGVNLDRGREDTLRRDGR